MITDKKAVGRLTVLFVMLYCVSYITRTNYGAIVAELESALGHGKTALSMALTGSFVTYGLGQILSGLLGDRISPKKLISLGLMVTVLMNVLLPFFSHPILMLVIWCINGFAQAFMWPPIIKLLSGLLSGDDYTRVSVKVSWGSSIGTIIVYLVSPLLISLLSWRAVFWFSAACGIVMLLVWHKIGPDLTIAAPIQKEKSKASFFHPVLPAVMLGIILQGMLRDGVTTWMPSLINEIYDLGTTVAILSGVILPIFSIVCHHVSGRMYLKIKNPLLCGGLVFGVGALAGALLIPVTGHHALLSILCCAVLTGCMHGVNVMLICMIPPFFKHTGRVSTVSGLLNACTYVGSALSTYGVALLSEQFDWSVTLWVWLGIAVMGTLVCLCTVKPWERFVKENIPD